MSLTKYSSLGQDHNKSRSQSVDGLMKINCQPTILGGNRYVAMAYFVAMYAVPKMSSSHKYPLY
jgi:hypothetical protein